MKPSHLSTQLCFPWRSTVIRLVCLFVLLVAFSGCGDVYIAASEHGAAAMIIEQAPESPKPAPPTLVPPQTEPTTSDHVAEIVAGFFVSTRGAVLLLSLLAWLLFPPGDRNR